jgi:hypothetical protein
MEFLALMVFHRIGLNNLAMGPASFIFSLLYQYSRIVPVAYNYRIFGLPLTNKSMAYLLALQVSKIHSSVFSFLMNYSKMAISRPPSSVAVAIIGILAGQIYRSDLASLNNYRISPTVVKYCSNYILPLIGSLRPARRTTRALPDEGRPASRRRSQSQNEEVITTARTPPASAQSRGSDNTATGTGTGSVVREWVNELTGRGEGRNAGIRVPTEDEILELTTIFPNVDRDMIVAALQRR